MMIVLKWEFCILFWSLYDKIHRTQMKLSLLMNSDTLICIWILVFPNGIIEFSTLKKWIFLLYSSSLHYYWPPSNWNSLEHTAWVEMERCEKRAFQLLKMRKKLISWTIKAKCVTAFFGQLCLRVWRIILVITG